MISSRMIIYGRRNRSPRKSPPRQERLRSPITLALCGLPPAHTAARSSSWYTLQPGRRRGCPRRWGEQQSVLTAARSKNDGEGRAGQCPLALFHALIRITSEPPSMWMEPL